MNDRVVGTPTITKAKCGMPDGITRFADFWPYYVSEHLHPVSRALHVLGSAVVLTLGVMAWVTQQWWLLLVAPLGGYGLAWIGHFGFERNRPATFKYPMLSLLSDWVMIYKILTGQMQGEIEKSAQKLAHLAIASESE